MVDTLQILVQQIEERDERLGLDDEIVALGDCRVAHDGQALLLRRPRGTGPMLANAERQLFGMLRADQRTLRSLTPDAMVAATEDLLARAPHAVRVRRDRQGQVRAVLPADQPGIPDLQLVQVILPVLVRLGGDLIDYRVSDDLVEARVEYPDSEARPVVGDVVGVGMQLRNSYVGAHETAVATVLHRVICTNLAICEERRWRAAADLGDVTERLASVEADVAALTRRTVQRGVAFEALQQMLLPDREAAVKALNRVTKLGAETSRRVTDLFMSGRQTLPSGEMESLPATAYGLWNSLTALARGTGDRSVMRAAGRMVDTEIIGQLELAYAEAARR